ncbi:MAG: dicarboxylate/amino acid:cation symporter [Opitutia bacterium]
MEYALGAAFFYAWSVTCARRSSAHHGPDLANLGRILVGLAAVGLFVGLTGRDLSVSGWGWLALGGALGLGVGDIALFRALPKIGVGLTMLLHLFGTMSLWLKFWTDRSPLGFFRDIRGVLVTAFSTSSSNATLPAALECARGTLGLRPSVSGFVLPLGTTMNMSGTALYEGCVVLFVAQVFGVELSAGQQMTLLLLSVLSAVAVAGIPGGSLPLIAGLLASFGIPPEGIGVVLGVDRILDMSRSMTNVGCDLVTTVVVDAQERRSDPG